MKEEDVSRLSVVDELMEEGRVALGEERFADALHAGERLEALRYSGAFEIMALALDGLGRRQEAVQALERGVGLARQVSPLWQLLGNFYSDDSRYDDATRCYENGLACENPERSALNLNYAICLLRQSRPQAALERLSLVDSPELQLKMISVQINALRESGSLAEAIALAGSTLDTTQVDENSANDLAGIHARLGECLLSLHGDWDEALSHVWRAVDLSRSEPIALKLIRDHAALQAKDARWYRLTLIGDWFEPLDESGKPLSFFANYEVLADNLEEALELAARFEPLEVRPGLRIEEQCILEGPAEQFRGVYWAGGRIFFPRDESQA
jgi:tetratricopeptide (TPR) repeat protein